MRFSNAKTGMTSVSSALVLQHVYGEMK